MIWYEKTEKEIMDELSSDEEYGLSEEEAVQRREKYGENKLKEEKKKSKLVRFLDQFKDAMILILITAAVISFVIACAEGETEEFFEPVLILFIVVVNAVIGVLQENKAERALEALKSLSAPHAKVIREGKQAVIEASKLVPGDIICLEMGDFVPADARLLKSASLKSEESALTGESVPVQKDAQAVVDVNAPLGDRINMVFSGCSITYGTGKAIVTAIGMKTEMGKIADLLNREATAADTQQTPLQQKLSKLGEVLGIMAVTACAIIFVVGILNGIAPLEIFMTAISLAVSAIPEGLPAIVTIVLSIGVQRMAARNAIIRSLPAVETLGSASVICSDKTGTLTQNRMTLVKVYTDRKQKVEEVGEKNNERGKDRRKEETEKEENGVKFVDEDVRKLLKYAVLCCNGSFELEGKKEIHIGDPTETAILAAAYKAGMEKSVLDQKYVRIAEIPFDSERKLMSTICRIDGKIILLTKGAFDVMAERCMKGDLEQAGKISSEMSEEALRVLAVGYRELAEIPKTLDANRLERDLIFMGLLGMIDPPRDEAGKAVEICKRAGIRPVMVTGDHILTATAIARKIGIFAENDRAVTGAELDQMSDRQLDGEVEQISVYARVSPENKIRIVKAWQRHERVVAMTGDGVNDAPALRAADIGCAMGMTGTDVAKKAADMTLTDDNFVTIVEAVREGRGIYANIKKVVGFLLGTNIGEVVTVFVAMLLWHRTPLMSMQLLWINLVTDSFPAIALGMEDVEDDVMEQQPKPKNEGMFANGFGVRVVLQGLMFGGLSLLAYWFGEMASGMEAGGQTLAFMVLSLSQIVQAFNMRSEHSLFQIGFFTNKRLNQAAIVSVFLVLIVLFSPASGVFNLIFLPWTMYLFGLALILVPLAVMEFSKRFGTFEMEE